LEGSSVDIYKESQLMVEGENDVQILEKTVCFFFRRRCDDLLWTTPSRRRPRGSGSTTPRCPAGSRSPRNRTRPPPTEIRAEKRVSSGGFLDFKI